jgi:hypothetical protein
MEGALKLENTEHALLWQWTSQYWQATWCSERPNGKRGGPPFIYPLDPLFTCSIQFDG